MFSRHLETMGLVLTKYTWVEELLIATCFYKLHADVSNVAINVPEEVQAPSLGSAILASVAAGAYNTIEEAVGNMVRFNKTVQPNRKNHERYVDIFKQYEKAYSEFGGMDEKNNEFSEVNLFINIIITEIIKTT